MAYILDHTARTRQIRRSNVEYRSMPKLLRPSAVTLQSATDSGLKDAKTATDQTLPPGMQGGKKLTLKLKGGDTKMTHGLNRVPSGIFCFSGEPLYMTAKDQSTYTLHAPYDGTFTFWLF